MENEFSFTNLKKDIKRAEAELKKQQEAEISDDEESVEKVEAEKASQEVKEKERLSKPQEVFVKKSEWKAVNEFGKVNLNVHLYGRKIQIGDKLILFGEKKGEVLETKISEIKGERADGATIVGVEK